MSLIKFLLGSKFGQRKKWKHEEDEKKKSITKVNFADPEQRRELMNCIAYSPGIPSDDQRFVDNWEDSSLTISESSLVTIISSPISSENIVTVVEVHAEDTLIEEDDEKQGELTIDEGPEDFEEEQHQITEEQVFEENVDDYSEGQIKHVAEEVVEEKEAENNDVKEDLEENINEAEVEDLKETDNNNEENAPQNYEEHENNNEEDLAPAAEPHSETSNSEVTEEDLPLETSTPDGDRQNSDEDELPDQLVPELAGSEYTESTTLSPTLSIEMETQTDLPPVPRETETQTDEPLPPAVSLRPNHLYKPCDPHEMRLLSVALSELEADMNKPPSRTCSCSGNLRPGPSTPNVAFTPEKNREIARENANLLSRLQRTHARIRKPSLPLGPPESSSSINRRKQQERIQRENLILLRKITAARGRGRGHNTLLSYY